MNVEKLLKTGVQLLAVPSTSDDPQALAQALAIVEEIVKSKEVTVEHFKKNGKPSLLAYKGKQRPEKFDVILNGHVDVVPAKPEQFEPYIQDDRLYGRGALDMKIAALAMADVFSRLAAELPLKVGLQIVTDEEIGGHNGTMYQIEQGVRAKFVIAGEFTKPAEVCVASRGICWAKVTLKGKAAHSAYLWEGENALLKANEYTGQLLKAYPVPSSNIWATTVNVAKAYTPNNALNRVPDEATLELDIRYVAEDGHFATHGAAVEFLKSIAPGAEVELLQYEPCHEVAEDNNYVQALAQSLAETSDAPVSFIRKHGAADVRFYSDRNVPAVVLGLQGEGLHGDTEFVEIASIARYQRTLEHFLTSLANR